VKILFEIGSTCRNYIVVYLFQVIWSMHSSDRMKTLNRIFKDYVKNIMFKDFQMHFSNIYWRRKELL